MIIDQNELIFTSEQAETALNMLVDVYKNDIDFIFRDHRVSDCWGRFSFNNECYNLKPKIYLWGGSSQKRLLVLIHELAHYHHYKRMGYAQLIVYPTIRAEVYAYYIGWGVIKQHRLDTLIGKDIWKAESFFKLWCTNYGMQQLHWREIHSLPTANQDIQSMESYLDN